MSKAGERAYLDRLGEHGRQYLRYKPFSNADCGLTLCSIGAVMSFMPPTPARVLDMGCGSGWTTLFFARHGFHVTGMDISGDMIALANACKAEQLPGAAVDFIESDYESASFPCEFDCAVFYDSLHHADDERAALRLAHDVLKPGGVLITHEPGAGHAAHPDSIAAMQQFGVNERDMPPSLIIRHALELGFTSYRIYPLPHAVMNWFYGPKLPPLFSRAGLRAARDLVRLAFTPSDQASSIVVLRK